MDLWFELQPSGAVWLWGQDDYRRPRVPRLQAIICDKEMAYRIWPNMPDREYHPDHESMWGSK